MSWRRTNPSLWVSPKALNNVLFCSNEVKLYLSLDKGRLVGYQQLEFEWQIPCVPIYLFLSIWWEDILVTGANLCSNTFFIWVPFNLVLLLSQLPASPQFRPADTNMRLFRELDSAQDAFMRMRALGAQVTVEKQNCASMHGCSCVLKNHCLLTALHSSQRLYLMSTSHIKCGVLWGVRVFMSWRGPSWQTNPPTHADLFLAYSARDYKNFHYWKMKTAWIKIWECCLSAAVLLEGIHTPVRKICYASLLMQQMAFY